MSEANEPAPNSGETRVTETEAGLTKFARHEKDLIALLRKAYERGGNAEHGNVERFDEQRAWRIFPLIAYQILQREANFREQATMPPGDRVKLLRQLEAPCARPTARPIKR